MLGWFAETTVVASVLAAVAALAGRMRPMGPTARHVLWLAVLVKLMTPPVVCWPWAVSWRGPDGLSVPRPSGPAARPLAVGLEGDAPVAPPRPAWIEEAGADGPATRPRVAVAEESWSWATAERGLLAAWLMAGGALAAGQGWRILRFRRRLGMAVPAPEGLVDEADRIAGRLGVRAPELLVVPGPGSPMLWCLGRPRLLLPAPLVATFSADRWRGILAHELAHLRRGDHWVCRLEWLAGLLWWWNPLFWLTRARLGIEAELACDAWVVWALPEDRLAYAEALFEVGSRLSRVPSPAPALGAVGSVRLLERRLIMILRDQVPCRLSPAVLLAALLLVLLAIPSWSAIAPAAEPPAVPAPALAAPAGQEAPISLAVDDDDDDDADDDDDHGAKARKDKARARRDAARAKRDAERAKHGAARPKGKLKVEGKDEEADVEIEKISPEFQKRMEALGREMEAKFGPGSEFEKQMEALGKQMEAKFGPGSKFEKQMKELGEEMEAKFGPGSEFEKKMKELDEEMSAKFGRGSEFEMQMKEKAGKAKERAEAAARKRADADKDVKRAEERRDWARRMQGKGYVSKRQLEEEAKLKEAEEAREKAGGEAEKPKARAAKGRRREARIAEIEAQIRKLSEQLKALEAQDDEDER